MPIETKRSGDVKQVTSTDVGGKESLDVNIAGGSISISGGATETKQDTANTSLAAIDGGVPAALGQGTMAQSMKVVIASDQSAVKVVGGNALDGKAWDYFSCNEASATQDVITYKTGGSGGSTVATVTINYTSAAQTKILNFTVA